MAMHAFVVRTPSQLLPAGPHMRNQPPPAAARTPRAHVQITDILPSAPGRYAFPKRAFALADRNRALQAPAGAPLPQRGMYGGRRISLPAPGRTISRDLDPIGCGVYTWHGGLYVCIPAVECRNPNLIRVKGIENMLRRPYAILQLFW